MLETINFRKAKYISHSLLHYLSFKGYAMKFIWYFFKFSLLLTLVTYFSKFFDIAINIVSEKKELSNGEGSFTFNEFRPFSEIVYTDD